MRVSVDGLPFDGDLCGAVTIGGIRAAVARVLARTEMQIVSCSVDGVLNPPSHASILAVRDIAFVSATRRSLLRNDTVMLSGEGESMAFDGRQTLAEAVAAFDAHLRTRRLRVSELTSAGSDVMDVVSMSKPCGSYADLSCTVARIRGERRAVVTLVLGSGFKRIADLCVPFARAYAKAHHADFFAIESAKIGLPFPHFEKWQLMSLFAKYERIMFVDSDVLIDPRAPDIFSAVPAESVGGFDEGADCPREDIIEDAQRALGAVTWTHGYLNSGVGVYSYLHRPLFSATEQDLVPGSRYFEQTTYNYRIAKYGYAVEHLPWQWNCMDNNGHDRFAAHAIHYAGSGYTGRNDLDVSTFFSEKAKCIMRDIEIRFGAA